MSGSEDMIEILVAERDRALREVMSLTRQRDVARADLERWTQKLLHHDASVERERDAARAEIAHLRRGIETYREYRRRVQNDQTDDAGWWECIEVLGIWEREDKQRDEKG